MLTPSDLQQLAQKGISEAQIEKQLSFFKSGFPYLPLVGAASVEKGILRINEQQELPYLTAWSDYLKGDGKITKFVPASGAASRMFKDLFEFIASGRKEAETSFEKKFISNIRRFAFYECLNQTCEKMFGKNIDTLRTEKNEVAIVKALLDKEGLGYGELPKGLLLFHTTPHRPVTPMEEHLVEGALYAQNNKGEVHLHFTVSPEHRHAFEALLEEVQSKYESLLGVHYYISFSEQKSATDTLAADENNQPFRDEKEKLLFRPGGHGALIENLNDLDADIIFIKNIDNVVPDRLKGATIHYKQLIAGVLVQTQQRVFEYLRELNGEVVNKDTIAKIASFLENDLYTTHEEYTEWPKSEQIMYLKRKLNRPIRVCGMVKNVGEPGGGPFIAGNSDGSSSLQILESSQINLKDEESKAMFESATHFNPVDLVCAVKDYQGNKFDLLHFVDPKTGFISIKSKNGKELKALELPGLWNGAMSDWLTLFVEVPIDTFNPVKTVNDLLRDEHNSGL